MSAFLLSDSLILTWLSSLELIKFLIICLISGLYSLNSSELISIIAPLSNLFCTDSDISLAFFCYNWRLPLTIRSIFFPLLGNKIWGWQGDLIDIIAVLATLFGLATSLGLGAQQASSGLFYLFNLPNNLVSESLVIIFITSVAIFSVYRGLDKGVRILSNLNIALALLLLLFVVFTGPTHQIISSYGANLIAYFQGKLYPDI